MKPADEPSRRVGAQGAHDDHNIRRRASLAFIGLALAALVVSVLLLDSHPLLESARRQLWGLNSLHHAEFDRKLPARQATNWYIGVGPGRLQPESPPPVITPSGGHFNGSVEVKASTAEAGAVIRCSQDGSIPTQRHARLEAPFRLTRTTVVRCRTFRSGHQPSATTTQTFLVDALGALPILAVTVDPTNLWNKYSGIYVQYREHGPEWERDAHVEYLPRAGKGALAIPGALRIHGYYSRSRPKKSLRFTYTPPPASEHNPANLLTWPTAAHQRTVVFGAKESDVSRDELFQSLFSASGGYAPANMPVFLYLNGEPWGIYYIRERIDEEFLQRRMGPGSYDLLDAQPGKPRVLAGDRKHWDRTVEFFLSNDFSDPQVFAAAARLIDIDNFTDYWLFNIYAANRDWPHHNMNMFRNRDSADDRWRWISWDADATFDFAGKGLQHDTLAWATRTDLRHDLRFNNEAGLRDNEQMLVSTLIARKLLENPDYAAMFANRMQRLLESDLRTDRVLNALEALHAETAQDAALDWARWSTTQDDAEALAAYNRDLARVRNFIMQRPAILNELFGLH